MLKHTLHCDSVGGEEGGEWYRHLQGGLMGGRGRRGKLPFEQNWRVEVERGELGRRAVFEARGEPGIGLRVGCEAVGEGFAWAMGLAGVEGDGSGLGLHGAGLVGFDGGAEDVVKPSPGQSDDGCRHKGAGNAQAAAGVGDIVTVRDCPNHEQPPG